MKIIPAVAALLSVVAATAAAADFQTFQPASVVLGQPDFTTTSAVSPAQPNRFAETEGVVMDPATGKVFVADTFNNRILRFSSAAAATNGGNPEAVFGQPNFSGSTANQGGAASASTLSTPRDLTIDATGCLWVADPENNRVLGYELAAFLGNDPPADIVLGQPDFTTTSTGLTAAKMNFPIGVSAGPGGVLYVADDSNHRVLRFDNAHAKANGANADSVLGQVNFTTATPLTAAAGMKAPAGVHADSAGRLWVADGGNHRVLRFDNAAVLGNDPPATGVLGQPDFGTGSSGSGPAKMNQPFGVYLDAGGNLWVCDTENNRVLRFAAATLANGGAANLVLGQPNFVTTAAAPASARSLNLPVHLSGGPGGSLLVPDFSNRRVLRFDPVPTPTPTPTPAPVVTVAGKKKITTDAAKITLKGSATNAVRIEVKVGKADWKAAKGSASWKFTAKLKPGKNKILIRALDATGAASPPVTVTITRR